LLKHPLLDKERMLLVPLLDKEGLGAVDDAHSVYINFYNST